MYGRQMGGARAGWCRSEVRSGGVILLGNTRRRFGELETIPSQRKRGCCWLIRFSSFHNGSIHSGGGATEQEERLIDYVHVTDHRIDR